MSSETRLRRMAGRYVTWVPVAVLVLSLVMFLAGALEFPPLICLLLAVLGMLIVLLWLVAWFVAPWRARMSTPALLMLIVVLCAVGKAALKAITGHGWPAFRVGRVEEADYGVVVFWGLLVVFAIVQAIVRRRWAKQRPVPPGVQDARP